MVFDNPSVPRMPMVRFALCLALTGALAGCRGPETKPALEPKPPAATPPRKTDPRAPATGGAKTAGAPAPGRAGGGAARPQQGARPGGGPAGQPKAPDAAGFDIGKLNRKLDSSNLDEVLFAAIEIVKKSFDNRTNLAGIAERLRDPNGSVGVDHLDKILNAITLVMSDYAAQGEKPGAVPKVIVTDLVDLCAPFLGHAEPKLRDRAVQAFAALDAIDPVDAQDHVALYVGRILDAPPFTPAPALPVRISAIRIAGRKKPPQQAISVLATAFERALRSEIKEAVRRELRRVTGQSFADARAFRAWWDRNRDKSQDDWYGERLERAERETAAAREAARALWKQNMALIASSPERQYAEMVEALLNNKVPEIRIDAAREIVKVGRPEAYRKLVDAIMKESDPEVRRAMLIDALAQSPPGDAALREELGERITPLADADEKDVRLAAVIALGKLRAEGAIPHLLKRLQNKTRDGEIAAATLAAISEIGGKANGTLGRALNDFLQQEIARAAGDPLRDLAILEAAAATIRQLQFGDRDPEGDRAARLVAQLLSVKDEADKNRSARVRQSAAITLGSLKRPKESFIHLFIAMRDADGQVAADAARALGQIAGGKLATEQTRREALPVLQRALDDPRPDVKTAALDGIRETLKELPLAPLSVKTLRDVAEKLALTKDYALAIKLLKVLPPRLSPEEQPPVRQDYFELRRKLAEAYELDKPPLLEDAQTIWAELDREDRKAHGEKYAQALAALGNEKADEVYSDLIRRVDPAGLGRYWRARLDLGQKLAASENSNDRLKARDLVQRMNAENSTLPPALQPELRKLFDKLNLEAERGEDRAPRPAPPGGSRPPPPSGTTLPGSVRGGDR